MVLSSGVVRENLYFSFFPPTHTFLFVRFAAITQPSFACKHNRVCGAESTTVSSQQYEIVVEESSIMKTP